MYTLRLEHGFSAAHQLTHAYSAECNNNLHGHNWRVIVVIKTPELLNEMVLDFKKIKEAINQLDHKNLNEILNFEPTAENLSKYIYGSLCNIMDESERPYLIEVEIFEADKASIKYEI